MTVKLRSGMVVEARYKGSKRLFPAIVVKVNYDTTYKVEFLWGNGRTEVMDKVARADIQIPFAKKDDYELTQMLFEERTEAVGAKLVVATRRGRRTDALLSSLGNMAIPRELKIPKSPRYYLILVPVQKTAYVETAMFYY